MVKGDDAIRRKKNKENRKRMRKESSAVSARVAAIIAAKKRRKSGKRRICEGMCFSLPTPDDPFNDGHESTSFNRKKTKKSDPLQRGTGVSRSDNGAMPKKDVSSRNPRKVEKREDQKEKAANQKNEQIKLLASNSVKGQRISISLGKTKSQLFGNSEVCGQQRGPHGNSESPSKFFVLCLNAIQSALQHASAFNCDIGRPLIANIWGAEYWKCYSVGLDIMETTGACSIEQIAWMVSTAADTIARKEKEGLSIASPFLLFLVQSQEKAMKIRSVCKPLKALGIHTVSLHPGASLEHQIHGLKSCEPEFLVSTPERLLELVSLKAIDLSGVSLMGVEVLEKMPRSKLYFQPRKVLFVVGTDNKAQVWLTTLRAKGYSISNESSSDGSQADNSEKSMVVSVSVKEHVGSMDIEDFEVAIIVDFLPSIDGYTEILTRMARHSVNGVLHSLLCEEDAPVVKPLIEILEQCGQAVPEALRNMYDSTPMLDH
ncbi:PREDICTED: uncharacterized protein LOC104612510 isoform X2 [Nelumbo nucifera]|uniref:Uncharacterized protein LOC104612510 isoform X2 n=1 Tax=Nelumbo nucifera TaxID=4432 RepID=A0A1U8QBB7_NELNU|nr:PREDICTED: uncharacterized protein LOC104612510 isoform X2 [Nelumbo nucifera]